MPVSSLEELFPSFIDRTHLYIFCGIAVFYILIRPLINWIIASNAVKLLSYVITSFVILNLLLGGIVLTSEFQMRLLEKALRILGVFGGCLVLVHAIQHMIRSKKNRV